MTAVHRNVCSADGTSIGYLSVGRGDAVVLVGGVLSTSEDYLPLAHAFAEHFEVHVVDRRGRGASGPQGRDYGIDKECEDLTAVLAATGARLVFGHSYGGLIALHAALGLPNVTGLALYEPGVSIDGSIPRKWLAAYRERLAASDPYGALAVLARGAGHAPKIVEGMPLSLVKLLLRVAMRRADRERIMPLLEPALHEHDVLARVESRPTSYASIRAGTLLLAGANSPRASTAALPDLAAAIPHSTLKIVPNLKHDGPQKAPAAVAAAASSFLLDSRLHRCSRDTPA
jgi:pimeloyl-ACP methyl ester carboxylesterase